MSERWFFKSFGLSEITGVFDLGGLMSCMRRENSFYGCLRIQEAGPGTEKALETVCLVSDKFEPVPSLISGKAP